MSNTTIIKLVHGDSAKTMLDRFGRSTVSTRQALVELGNYFHALAAGSRSAQATVSVGEATGAKATGTVVISSGSGVITATINGVDVSVTWATSDDNTGTLLANAINASTAVGVAGYVTAANVSGTVTITASASDASGDTITLAATGTGATASGTTLTGSVAKAASGTLTSSSGSGTVGGTIGGTAVTVTWGTSDTATATALAAAINAQATVNKWVVATSALGVVTVTAIAKGKIGNNITLVASGTGMTASVAKLAGGTDAAYTTYDRS